MIAARHSEELDLARVFGERGRGLAQRLVTALRQAVPVEEIWLFGSCARGDAQPGSDLDVLVVLPDDHGLARPTLECYRAIQRLHSGVPVDVVATTRSFWERDSADGFGPIGDAFREGIRLYGNRREESSTLV
ncbi:MAG: nucleotidyltransferase domain-containing protein [Chloroflexi bacterium]|nr:nucleotidyltransferase domain-containing protein [Chloroflexota bacterium]